MISHRIADLVSYSDLDVTILSMSRIAEWLAVVILVTAGLFSPLLTGIVIVALACRWSLPLTLFICFLYGSWLWIDRRIEDRGGRRSEWLRRCSIWTPFTRYFPLVLVKSAELDPKRNYIFGYHPHGLFCLGALGNFCTEATHFSRTFPGIRPHLMLLRLQFLFPFSRDLFLGLGACHVSRESCEYLLSGRNGLGHALVIVLGGIPEMKLAREGTMLLYLKARKGFIELALQHGASLVPVISFGENELYHMSSRGFLWGRSILGHTPRRHRVVTVVGEPIHVEQILQPTMEDIDQWHQKYLRAVENLFEKNKMLYGLDHVQLQIV